MRRIKEKGITLVSLIITIIVMLILMGVVVTLALGGGLFNIAKKATEETKASMVEEMLIYEFPDDFIRLEYIESTGTQYIETNYKPRYTDEVEIKFKTVGYQHMKHILGCSFLNEDENLRQNFNIYIYSNQLVIYKTKQFTDDYNFLGLLKGDITFSTYKNSYNVNGENGFLKKTTDFGSIPLNAYLFSKNNNETEITDYRSKAIFYSLKIKRDGHLIHDYIPVVSKLSGEIGIYDLVSHHFFKNKGTGEFIAGPEKKN